jgi:hypothetical protein
MWTSERTVAGFTEVLRVVNPNRILVIGKSNWEMMAGGPGYFPDAPPIREDRFKLPSKWRDDDGPVPHAYWYQTRPGNFALCAPIYHPAYPKGFFSPDTTKIVDKLLRKDWTPPTRKAV